ncbi:MAG: response regulator [Elusimicrobia bacterium]|nr:response regulator [Elusimicrobiota bacterium]
MREMLAWALAQRGFEIIIAVDGEAAAEALARRRVDVVVTDLTMPRADGLALLAAARAIRPDLAVIVVTGFATVETAVLAMRAGARDFLLKPFDLEALSIRIEEICRRTR